jgi:mono/diheme cytochrome c family protein
MNKDVIGRRASRRRPSRKSGLILAGLTTLGLAVAGCQGSTDVQTQIPALPPGAQHAGYVTNLVLTNPSEGVDAGRQEVDAATGESRIVGGMGVYVQNCARCHGGTGKPPAGSPGTPDLSDPVFSWTKTPQDFFRDLLSSPAHQQSGTSNLDRQELWNSVFYAWSLHSTVDDVVQGGLVFGRYCSVCHGTKGLGDGNLSGDLNPRPRRFTDFPWMVDKTDQRLYISISDGRPPSAMPAWKEALSPTQRIRIINYLRQFTYRYPADIQKKMSEQPPAT